LQERELHSICLSEMAERIDCSSVPKAWPDELIKFLIKAEKEIK